MTLAATKPASNPVGHLTGAGLTELKTFVVTVAAERESLRRAIEVSTRELADATSKLRRAQHWFLRLFLGRKVMERQANVASRSAELEALENQIAGTYVDADFGLTGAAQASFNQLTSAFEAVAGCAKIWDVTALRAQDRRVTRSSASTSVARVEVRFSFAPEDDVIQTDARALCMGNADGADLVLYPGLLVLRTEGDVALIDLRELTVHFEMMRFVESDPLPPDAEVIDRAWAKTNKDGSPDRRFANNYQFPVARYAALRLTSPTGLDERFQFSSFRTAELFARALSNHQAQLRALAKAMSMRETARYTISTIKVGCESSPVLVMRYAGEGTPGHRIEASPNDVGGLELDAALFAKHVVVAWENVVSKEGTVPPCTSDEVGDFFSGLIRVQADIFRAIVTFARDPKNFTEI